MSFEDKLKGIINRYDFLDKSMYDIDISPKDRIAYSKESSLIESVTISAKEYFKISDEIQNLEQALKEESDEEILVMYKEEITNLKRKKKEVVEVLRCLLIKKDASDIDDQKNVILEVRAGTGGEEAALFASDLFRMYQKYSELKKWKFEILGTSITGKGGFKDGSAAISGKGVFSRLKFESGVHRVQRIPETESSGRIHTSAATVAVLPEPEDVEVDIQEKDLRVDVYRASGPGGQSVNTTDSAIRITHTPSGIVVIQQDEKSQHKNKNKAMKILRARLYELERTKKDAEISSMRKQQVGSGDRSERIRTYNFPQGRITDHRINYTCYKITSFVKEGQMDEVIEALIAENEAKILSNIEEQ